MGYKSTTDLKRSPALTRLGELHGKLWVKRVAITLTNDEVAGLLEKYADTWADLGGDSNCENFNVWDDDATLPEAW